MIQAKIIKDSVANGIRLTTMEVQFHRFILPEVNTHRMFSRNYTSSRAIPSQKLLEQVSREPAIPTYWGVNRMGMQAMEELTGNTRLAAKALWELAAESASSHAAGMLEMKLHKQITNRLIEPFMWTKGIITATEWDNFFKLRIHPAAQPEIQALAKAMKQAMDESVPTELKDTEWHLPYIREEEMGIDPANLIKMSAARCARVSYDKHDGTSPSIEDDLELYNQLATRPHTDKRGFVYGTDEPVHLSPLEHQVKPMKYVKDIWSDEGQTHMDKNGWLWSGNLKGWVQARQLLGK